jgi:hypothetical protein
MAVDLMAAVHIVVGRMAAMAVVKQRVDKQRRRLVYWKIARVEIAKP